MTVDELIARLDIRPNGHGFRVNARESADLEFKLTLDLRTFQKSLKTISAFASQNGGTIVFGIRDKPRDLVGIGGQHLDEGIQSEHLMRSISPCPETTFYQFQINGMNFAALYVSPLRKPPSIAIRDLSGDGGVGHILQQGMVYRRRRGQTSAISGEEFSQLLSLRDERIREEIFGFLALGRDVGFDKVIVADSRGGGAEADEVTFYLPAEAARDLNVVERARLVESDGAPAYEIRGNVRLTVPGDNDPRIPLRASESVEEMRPALEQIFWERFPWTFSHIKRATEHLGFWPDKNGDAKNTGREPMTGTTVYYDHGRRAVLKWATENPADFVQVVGSKLTNDRWEQEQVE